MVTSLRLEPSRPPFGSHVQKAFAGSADARCKLLIRSRPNQRFSSLTLQTPSDAAACEPHNYNSTVGSSLVSSSLQLSQWSLTQRHITILNVIACLTAISATWLLCSAIPALLAFKRAAESLEKLVDVTRDELPDTMAAIRLSGMEISDLTMELSDLGQEITQGVKNSTRAVRVAEEGIRRLTNRAPSASLQTVGTPKCESGGPVVARTARSMREGIVQGRVILQMFFSLSKFSRFALNYVIRRRKS